MPIDKIFFNTDNSQRCNKVEDLLKEREVPYIRCRASGPNLPRISYGGNSYSGWSGAMLFVRHRYPPKR